MISWEISNAFIPGLPLSLGRVCQIQTAAVVMQFVKFLWLANHVPSTHCCLLRSLNPKSESFGHHRHFFIDVARLQQTLEFPTFVRQVLMLYTAESRADVEASLTAIVKMQVRIASTLHRRPCARGLDVLRNGRATNIPRSNW